MPQAYPTDTERGEIERFIASMPLALEREDIRAVHASWGPVEGLRSRLPLTELFRRFEHEVLENLQRDGTQRTASWRVRWQALQDQGTEPTLDRELQDQEYCIQNGNPIKWLTSGPEGKRDTLTWLSGRWRQLERLAWWRGYHDATPVVIGHYWRTLPVGSPCDVVQEGMFQGATPHGGLGPLQNVFCIDYSVGKRFLDRIRSRPLSGRLAALLWPERLLVFDDGQVLEAC